MSYNADTYLDRVAAVMGRPRTTLNAQQALAAQLENAIRHAFSHLPFLVAAEHLEAAARELHTTDDERGEAGWEQLTDDERFRYRRLVLRMLDAAAVRHEDLPETAAELERRTAPAGVQYSGPHRVPTGFTVSNQQRAEQWAADHDLDCKPPAPLEALGDQLGMMVREHVLSAAALVSAEQQYQAARDLFVREQGDDDRSQESRFSGRFRQWARAWDFASPRKQAETLIRAKQVLEAAGLRCAPAL